MKAWLNALILTADAARAAVAAERSYQALVADEDSIDHVLADLEVAVAAAREAAIAVGQEHAWLEMRRAKLAHDQASKAAIA